MFDHFVVHNSDLNEFFGKMFFARLSTIFGVQQTPFHPNSYTGEDQEPIVKVDEFGQTKVRAAPTSVMRWRFTRNNKGEKIRQSNTKLVRWSDGTLCLYVGEERFAVTESELRVPYVLCTKSSQALHSDGVIGARMMFQPTSKAATQRGARRTTSGLDAPVVITPQVAVELKARADAQEEANRLNQQNARKRKGGPSGSASRLDADFLEEGTDLGATKAHFRSKAALARESVSSQRLMDIKAGRAAKRRKIHEEDDEEDGESDNSFIAPEDEDDIDISDEE